MGVKINVKDKGFNNELVEIIDPILKDKKLFNIFVRIENTPGKDLYIDSTLERLLLSNIINEDEGREFKKFYSLFLQYSNNPKRKKGDFLEYMVTKAFKKNSIISYEADVYVNDNKIGNKYFDNIVCQTQCRRVSEFIYLEGDVYFIECKHNIDTYLYREQPATKALEKLDYMRLIYDKTRKETNIDATFKVITLKSNVEPSNKFMKNNIFKGKDYEFINVVSILDIQKRLFS